MKTLLITVLATVIAGAGIGPKKTEPTYTETDLYVLSHIISAEAGNCQEEMMLYVGSVVLNRVADNRFPDTIEGVVFDPGQYSPTWNGTYYNEPTSDAVMAAEKLLEEGSKLPEYVIYQSNEILGEEYTHLDPPPGIGKRMYFCY